MEILISVLTLFIQKSEYFSLKVKIYSIILETIPIWIFFIFFLLRISPL